LFNAPARTAIYALSLHDALPISLQSTGTLKGPNGNALVTRTGQSTYVPGQGVTQGATYTGPGGRSVTTSNNFTRSGNTVTGTGRSEEHTSELQSLTNLVCRLLLA